MKQTKIQLLTLLATLLCLSSSLCYHTAVVVEPERGDGLAQDKRVPGTLQKEKSRSTLNRAKVGQEGGRDRYLTTSDGLRKAVPLLRALKRLLDSEDLLPELETNKRPKMIQMAEGKMETLSKRIEKLIQNKGVKQKIKRLPLETKDLRSYLATKLYGLLYQFLPDYQDELLQLPIYLKIRYLQYLEIILRSITFINPVGPWYTRRLVIGRYKDIFDVVLPLFRQNNKTDKYNLLRQKLAMNMAAIDLEVRNDLYFGFQGKKEILKKK